MSPVCRFSFNTGFIPKNGALIFKKMQIDPYKFTHSKKVSDHFAIKLKFEELCSCTADLNINYRCQVCVSGLSQGEKDKWAHIKNTIVERINENSSVLLFGDSRLDDIDELLNFTN